VNAHAARSLLKQETLSRAIAPFPDFKVLRSEGKLAFYAEGGQLARAFPLQILATVSKEEGSWLWGWANAASGIPAGQLASCQAVRDAGEREGCDVLRQASVDLSKVSPELLCLVAVGLARADGYYKWDYGAGVLVMAVHDAGLGVGEAEPMQVIASTFTDLVSRHADAFDERPAWEAYLTANGLTIHKEERKVIGTSARSGSVQATFDAQGRLEDVSSEARA
jgi:hypothetical protein